MMSDAIDTFLLQAADMLQGQAVNEAPIATGKLRADISVIEEPRAHEISVGNTKLIEYAKYVYYGTGLHGPKKRRITPKKAKALKTPYGYRKSTAGQKANPYLDRALDGMVSSGKLRGLLDGFGDSISEEIFEEIAKGLKTISVK